MFRTILLYFIVLNYLFFFNISYAIKRKKLAPLQSSLVINADTGRVLHDNKSKLVIIPASIVKLMTLYLLFESLESGIVTLNQKLYVSKKAALVMPSKLGVKQNTYITVKEAMLAIAIKSANDASIIVAENLKGSERKFTRLMNFRAKQLGMNNTNFVNSSGIPSPVHNKTTARDIAKLAIAIKRDFPQHYSILSKNSFVFRGKIIKGHNRVNSKYKWAKWGKTGFVNASGYNLLTEASKNGNSLIGIVIGSKTCKSRDAYMIKLLNSQFSNLSKRPIKLVKDHTQKDLKDLKYVNLKKKKKVH